MGLFLSKHQQELPKKNIWTAPVGRVYFSLGWLPGVRRPPGSHPKIFTKKEMHLCLSVWESARED